MLEWAVLSLTLNIRTMPFVPFDRVNLRVPLTEEELWRRLATLFTSSRYWWMGGGATDTKRYIGFVKNRGFVLCRTRVGYRHGGYLAVARGRVYTKGKACEIEVTFSAPFCLVFLSIAVAILITTALTRIWPALFGFLICAVATHAAGYSSYRREQRIMAEDIRRALAGCTINTA